MTEQRSTRRRLGSGIALVAAGLIGGLGATAANASFTDVPEEGGSSEHVQNLQEAGIATGYPDGSFRPTSDISRRQTSAWLNRSLSRVGLGDIVNGSDTPVLDAANPTATLTHIEMTSPAAGDGHGWVTLQGGVGGVAIEGGENCPCTVRVYLRDSSSQLVGQSILTITDPAGGLAFATTSMFAVAPIDAGTTEVYSVDLELLDPDVTVALGGAVYGFYAPIASGEFDGTSMIESDRRDPVESLVPEIHFPGAP